MEDIETNRISTLPDDLLIDVLSFLSTREAVQTSILAKRWRNTWESVPVLTFDLDDFLSNSGDRNNKEKRKECEDKFEQFVNGVLGTLENREHSYLREVLYYLENKASTYLDNNSEASMEWLNRVALLKPRFITVVIFRKNVMYVPDSVFSCASLQELELSLCGNNLRTFVRPKLIDLPSLQVLELNSVTLDDDFERKLFLGCPALQSLHLGCCQLGFSSISSKVLKTLVLEDCVQGDQMQICCPSLVSLDIGSYHQRRGILLESTASLVNADISIKTAAVSFDGDLNILRGLSNVSTLKLDLRRGDLKVHCLLSVY